MGTSGGSWSWGAPPGQPGQTAHGVMTGTTKITGQPIIVGRASGASWTMRWTGTPVGVFNVEGSNEYDPQSNPTALDWTTLNPTLQAGTNPAGGALNSGIDVTLTSFKALRLTYTNASGTGDLVAFAWAKGV